MKKLALLCDVAADVGGAERYWETVLPALYRQFDVRLYARLVNRVSTLGKQAQTIPWSGEHDRPSREAAEVVGKKIARVDAVITANVLDAAVLEAVRDSGKRWILRIHDHRAFCPNGNKYFPQFPAPCEYRMGGACIANALLRGCVCGPHRRTVERLQQRLRVLRAMRGADVAIMSSRYMRELAVQNGMDAARIKVLPPPVDPVFHEPRIDRGGDGILYAGRLEPEKGVDVLIDAVAAMDAPRPVLRIAGSGGLAYETHLRRLARMVRVDVEWAARVSQIEVCRAIDDARVVAFPSVWPEPFGLTAAQAIARGRPVVASDVGGLRECVANAGEVVAPGNAEALRASLERLFGDARVWQAASDAAKARAPLYQLDRHLHDLIPLLEPPMKEAA